MEPRRRAAAPAPLGRGLLSATIDAGNFAVMDPGMSRALVSVSKAMLEQPYYARYELIELAFLTLATRAQGSCRCMRHAWGKGNGVLLIGAAAGKARCLHALAADAAAVRRQRIRSSDSARDRRAEFCIGTGFARFVRRVRTSGDRAVARHSTTGRARSSRSTFASCADSPCEPLRLVATVFVAPRRRSRDS
jgi:hypothetical protein